LDRLISGANPALGDFFCLFAIASEKNRGISFDALVLFASEQSMDRLFEALPFQVPEGHIDGTHRGDRDRSSSKILGAPIHLLPEALGFQRIFAQYNFTK